MCAALHLRSFVDLISMAWKRAVCLAAWLILITNTGSVSENQAFNKSSTSPEAPIHPSSNAVDGSLRSDESCFHAIDRDLDQWLQVDLGRNMRVREIWLLNHQNYHQRMRLVYTRVGNSSATWHPGSPNATLCYYHQEADTGPGAWLQDSCNKSVVGRYVGVFRSRFQTPHTHPDTWEFDNYLPLALYELAVITDPVDTPKPEKVKNLNVVDRSQTTLTVRWDDPEYTNLVLHEYKIAVLSRGPSACSQTETNQTESIVVQGNVTEYKLANLQPFTTYEVIVQAVTLELEGGGIGDINRVVSSTKGKGSLDMPRTSSYDDIAASTPTRQNSNHIPAERQGVSFLSSDKEYEHVSYYVYDCPAEPNYIEIVSEDTQYEAAQPPARDI